MVLSINILYYEKRLSAKPTSFFSKDNPYLEENKRLKKGLARIQLGHEILKKKRILQKSAYKICPDKRTLGYFFSLNHV
jgi:hypothetical protein